MDRASRIEQQNAIFQRNFYRLYSLETQALRLVNNTRNKYTRMTPNEAVAAPDGQIAPRYNTAREQAEEDYRAVTINQGDRVRHLRNIRKRIRGIGYKAYRGDHWSKQVPGPDQSALQRAQGVPDRGGKSRIPPWLLSR